MKNKTRTFLSFAIIAFSFVLGGCAGDYSISEPETVPSPTISELVIFTDSIKNEQQEETEITTVFTPKTVIETNPTADPQEVTKGEYVEYTREPVTEPETTVTKSSKKKNKNKTTESIEETTAEQSWTEYDNENYAEYSFRTKKQLNQHFEKHGDEFSGDFNYQTAEDYEKGASDVINNPEALFKYESDDGDSVYYIENTNEFVILSTDGYIRTYFRPSSGIKYFNKQ